MFNDNWINNYDSKIKYIIGADEVGTGACAGPFVVCAVKAPPDWDIAGLGDSKKLSEKKRSEMEIKILNDANSNVIKYSLLEITCDQVDQLGLGNALKYAHQCVVNNLADEDSVAIVDGKLKIEAKCQVDSLIKADNQVPTVMAASILAKTYRDKKMRQLHEKYPMYGWNQNVGYVVANHKEAIKAHGLSPFHRKSYKLKGI